MRPAILLLLAACFTKPPEPNTVRDAPDGDAPVDSVCGSQPSAPGLQVESDADPVVTFPGNATLGFASDANRYPWPTSLRVRNQELVASPEGCNLEDQVGIAVYPVYSSSGNDAVTENSAHALVRELVGPAFTMLRTTWQYRYDTCAGLPTFGTGHTSWSLFPDGRVVRNDYVVPSMSEPAPLSPAGCQCSSASNVMNYLVTSYFAFETAALRSVTSDMHTAEFAAAPVDGEFFNDRAAGCVRGTMDGRVAFRWDLPGATQPTPYPTRIKTNDGGSAHLETAFVYDLARVPNAIAAGANYGIRTHMLIDGSNSRDCIQMTEDVSALASQNPILVDGNLVNYAHEGIYNDAAVVGRTHAGPVTVSAMSGSTATGFTIGLRFPGFSAIRTSEQTAGVVWQRGPDDLFFVFFPGQLVGGASLTITPEC